MNIEWLGVLAGTFTTAAFVPQVYKTWKSKSAKDLSLGMFLIFTVGVVLWLIYGWYMDAFSILFANSITLVLALILLYFKWTYKS